MHELRRFGPEKLERRLIAGEKCRGKLSLPLLHEAGQRCIHNRCARPLVGACQGLFVPEPEQKLVQAKQRSGRRMGKRLKFVLRSALGNIDEIGEKVILQTNAVQKHLVNIADFRLHGLFRLPRRFLGRLLLFGFLRGFQIGERRKHLRGVEAFQFLLRNRLAVLRGAQAHKFRNADGSNLLLKLDGLFHVAGFCERDAVRRLSRALADLG